MSKKLMTLAALSLVCAACGDGWKTGDPPSAEDLLPFQAEARGARVYANVPVDPNELAYLLDVAGYWMAFDGDYNVRIELTDEQPVTSDGDKVWGFTRVTGNRLIRVWHRDSPCLGSTPLAHELGHWVQFLKTGDGDGDHKSEMFEGDHPRVDIVWAFARAYCKQTADTQAWLRASAADYAK